MMGEVELHFAYRAGQEEKELVLTGDEPVSYTHLTLPTNREV